MPDFASRIRECRKCKGFTQKQMAAELDISEILWRNYEAGNRRPTFEGLLRLARYFGVSLDYLVGWTDDPEPAMQK